MTVGVGDKLMAYVQIDPCDPPGAVMLQFYDGDWNQRAYWGAVVPNYSFGPDGTPSRLRIGDMPKFGVWTRLEVPAASLGLEGKSITGMKFSVWGGRAWFDAVGKVPSQGAAQNLETEESVPVSLGVTTKFLAETTSTLTVDRYSLYTPELQLMAETNTTATTPWVAHEYIWFGGEPLAQVEVASGNLSYYFNDHLGAPILQTDATGAVVWRVERDPYGERYATRVGAARHQPLGLPGQEYDASSDRQYNIFRWYRPSWGRYTQSDPLLTTSVRGQLAAPASLVTEPYVYAAANPVRFVDPRGLTKCESGDCADCPSGVWTLVEAQASGFLGIVGINVGKVTLRCVGAPKKCDYNYWCAQLGVGADIGVGVAGGLVGGCKCAEDFAGWGLGQEASAGAGLQATGGYTVSPDSFCGGFNLGGGFGKGVAAKVNAYCSTTLVGCE